MKTRNFASWYDASWSPWLGCDPVSRACRLCHVPRLGGVPKGQRMIYSPEQWKRGATMQRRAEEAGMRLVVMLGYACDFFDNFSGAVSNARGGYPSMVAYDFGGPSMAQRPIFLDDLRAATLDVIDASPSVDWVVLTQRPDNIAWMLGDKERENLFIGVTAFDQLSLEDNWTIATQGDKGDILIGGWLLCLTPMLGPITLNSRVFTEYGFPDWVLVSGELGPGGKEPEAGWITGVVQDCADLSIPAWVEPVGIKGIVFPEYFGALPRNRMPDKRRG